MAGVSVQRVVDKMKMQVFNKEINLEEIMITTPEVNRPGLELTGFFEHFTPDRVQALGNVETTYLRKLETEKRKEIYRLLMDRGVPAIVLCRGIDPDPEMMEAAVQYKVPLLGTEIGTSEFLSRMIYYLQTHLADSISIHGVLVDVYGEGVLIMGESGIGKSEAALELIRRGHRLVTDDVVEIRKINGDTLVGTSPDITRYFIELRGIGIIDVKALFGVECVKEKQNIDLVINLEEWQQGKKYDRLGLEQEHTEILGCRLISHSIPIRPGRNLAVICEAAAVNHRQKKMGYNAAEELYRRVQSNLTKGMQNND